MSSPRLHMGGSHASVLRGCSCSASCVHLHVSLIPWNVAACGKLSLGLCQMLSRSDGAESALPWSHARYRQTVAVTSLHKAYWSKMKRSLESSTHGYEECSI
eukprot:3862775-Amphidinium_carterae.1